MGKGYHRAGSVHRKVISHVTCRNDACGWWRPAKGCCRTPVIQSRRPRARSAFLRRNGYAATQSIPSESYLFKTPQPAIMKANRKLTCPQRNNYRIQHTCSIRPLPSTPLRRDGLLTADIRPRAERCRVGPLQAPLGGPHKPVASGIAAAI